MSTNIEKQSLEAHVELCAERYDNLDSKLNGLEKRMDKLEEHVLEIKESISEANSSSHKTIITIGTTVVGVLISGCLTLIIHLIMKG